MLSKKFLYTLYTYSTNYLYLCRRMTKNRHILTLLVVICNILAATAGNQLGYSKYQPLGIGLDLDYAPLEYVDQEGLPQGLDFNL